MTALDVPLSTRAAGHGGKALNPRLLLVPPAAYMVATFGAALAVFLVAAFLTQPSPGEVALPLTWDHWRQLFVDDYYALILWRTAVMSFAVVGLTLVLSYPLAYAMARSRTRFMTVCLAIVLASMTMSLVIRALGWIGMLDSRGPVNLALMSLGLVESPVRFIGTMAGSVIGLVHGFIPIMSLALLPVMQAIDGRLEDAAAGLGASRWTIFRAIVLPLSFPGVMSASCLVFAMSMGTFTTPALLGGGKAVVFSELILEQVSVTLNYAFAAVMASTLVAIVLPVLWLGSKLGGRSRAAALSV